MDIKTLFTTTNTILTERMIHIKPEHFSLLAPLHIRYSDQLTLRDAINIQAHENASVPRVLAGEKNISANYELKEDLLPDDFVAAFQQLTEVANTAVQKHDDLEQLVHLSYGDFPAKDYLRDIIIERSLTAYDVAQTIGLEAALPAEVVQQLWDILLPIADLLHSMQVLPTAITVSGNAPLEHKLLASAGRDPSAYLS
ncbi:MAG TPA: hypothetical protein VD907_03600 [Verrucomicrobiae bacterium]|nr:hypothetical protein [Verrucomicrobiae bacterium]